MLRHCAWCKRVFESGEWITPDPAKLHAARLALEVTDGICPPCAEVQDYELAMLEEQDDNNE